MEIKNDNKNADDKIGGDFGKTLECEQIYPPKIVKTPKISIEEMENMLKEGTKE